MFFGVTHFWAEPPPPGGEAPSSSQLRPSVSQSVSGFTVARSPEVARLYVCTVSIIVRYSFSHF